MYRALPSGNKLLTRKWQEREKNSSSKAERSQANCELKTAL